MFSSFSSFSSILSGPTYSFQTNFTNFFVISAKNLNFVIFVKAFNPGHISHFCYKIAAFKASYFVSVVSVSQFRLLITLQIYTKNTLSRKLIQFYLHFQHLRRPLFLVGFLGQSRSFLKYLISCFLGNL